MASRRSREQIREGWQLQLGDSRHDVPFGWIVLTQCTPFWGHDAPIGLAGRTQPVQLTPVLPRSLFQMITRSPERRPDAGATIADTANRYSTPAAANRKRGSERIITEDPDRPPRWQGPMNAQAQRNLSCGRRSAASNGQATCVSFSGRSESDNPARVLFYTIPVRSASTTMSLASASATILWQKAISTRCWSSMLWLSRRLAPSPTRT